MATEQRCTLAVSSANEVVVHALRVSDVPRSSDQRSRSYSDCKVSHPDAELRRPYEKLRARGENERGYVRDRHCPCEQCERHEQPESRSPTGASEPVRSHESPQRGCHAGRCRKGKVEES